MNLEKIFKNLVRAELLYCFGFFIYTLYAGALNDTSLPEDALSAAVDEVISSSEVAGLIVALVYIVNLYLLFKFKPIGKLLFVPLVLITASLSLAMPIEFFQFSTPFEYLFATSSTMIEGAIITMLYLTAIKDRFVK